MRWTLNLTETLMNLWNTRGCMDTETAWGIVFRGISASYLPMLKIYMVIYHDEKHIWPNEKLYKYLIQKYFGHKKFKKYGIYY